ncbi:MAG: glycoside hydrolase family 15 protein [Candidatus Bathyarchaeia archaeon]
MKQKIKKLTETSKQVILDCAIENGAIVAANCFKEYFPKEAKHYTYVWPRDASFACVAADILGIEVIQERFFDWCLRRAEGFVNGGLFYENYFVNGLKASGRFQPDQTGSVLWAVWHHFKGNMKGFSKYEGLVRKAADGICSKWNGDHFTVVTNDLWEERLAFPDLKENFTYSLAACIGGLERANELLPNEKWVKTAREMRKRLEKHFDKYFFRSCGEISDKRIDASMLGLVYPFEVFQPDDPRVVATVKEIEKKLVVNGGVHRYENDDYDGWIWETMHRNKGAGAWPILNFWMSIYYAKLGDKRKALQYYNWVLKKVDRFIPEQIFDNPLQVSVSPLCWSHAMFIIASRELGYL